MRSFLGERMEVEIGCETFLHFQFWEEGVVQSGLNADGSNLAHSSPEVAHLRVG